MTNPFAPPQPKLSSASDGQLSEPIVVDLLLDRDYVTRAIERTRERNPIRRLWMIVRWPCAAILFLTAVALAFNAPFYWSIVCLAFTVGSFFAYRIDDFYYIWSLKRSGWLNATCHIEMSNAGYRVEAQGYDLTVPWSTFRCTDIFDDGILLFQAPHSSPWIPWSAVSSKDEQERLSEFAKARFRKRCKTHRSRKT